MKRNVIGVVLTLLTFAAVIPPAMTGAQRLAIVKLESLVRAHPHTAADKQQLEETLRGYEAEGERLREHVDALGESFRKAEAEAEDPALSAQARQRAASAAAEAREAWVEAREDWREQMERMQQRLTEQELRLLNRTVSELRRVIGDYAEAEGIALVLDASERRMGATAGILFADEALDITPVILERIGAAPAETDAEAALP